MAIVKRKYRGQLDVHLAAVTYFVRSTSLDEAKARLKEFGGENIRLIRELTEEKAQELRNFLRTK